MSHFENPAASIDLLHKLEQSCGIYRGNARQHFEADLLGRCSVNVQPDKWICLAIDAYVETFCESPCARTDDAPLCKMCAKLEAFLNDQVAKDILPVTAKEAFVNATTKEIKLNLPQAEVVEFRRPDAKNKE